MSRTGLYVKMAATFLGISLGGPLLMYYVTPAEGELFKRFSPDLQKRNLEMRELRQQNYEEFTRQMIEYSKSDKPIWEVAEQERQKARDEIVRREREERNKRENVRGEMRTEREREMREGK